jgi:hypothetical protein
MTTTIEEQKKDFLRWAIATADTLSEQELGDDWWGAYNEDWDINIWWDLYTYRVTAYPMTAGVMNTADFIACGAIMPVWMMKDDSCSICGDVMGRTKHDGDQPVRLKDGDEFAHLRCSPL